MSVLRLFLSYLIVGEILVALLITFSKQYCAVLRKYTLTEAVLSSAYVICTWPWALQEGFGR